MKKIVLGLVAATAVAAPLVFAAGPASAAGAQQETDPAGKSFTFWDGNGYMPGDNIKNFVPSSYHDVVTPNGAENEVFKGVIANDTGGEVVYTAGVGPVPADQKCGSFVTGRTTPDWEMTIGASGKYTLTCHFAS